MSYQMSKYTYVEQATRQSVVLANRLTNKRIKLEHVSAEALEILLDGQSFKETFIEKSESLKELRQLGFLCSDDEDEAERFYCEPVLQKASPTFINAPNYKLKDEPDIVVVGLPYNQNSKIQDQTDVATTTVRNFSTKVHYQTDITGAMKGIKDNYLNRNLLKGKRLADLGNLLIPAGMGHKLFAQNVQSLVQDQLDSQTIPVFIGGNHSITAATVPAMDTSSISIIHFDAHLDNDLLISSLGVTHSNVIRKLYSEPRVEEIISVGIRGFGNKTAANKHSIISTHRWTDCGPDAVIESLDKNKVYYLSIDMDVLDPSHAPGVSYGEPFGCSPRLLIDTIHQLGRQFNIAGCDLVEFNTANDHNNMTAILSVNILLNLMDAIA